MQKLFRAVSKIDDIRPFYPRLTKCFGCAKTLRSRMRLAAATFVVLVENVKREFRRM
jgi:hypothetical protein